MLLRLTERGLIAEQDGQAKLFEFVDDQLKYIKDVSHTGDHRMGIALHEILTYHAELVFGGYTKIGDIIYIVHDGKSYKVHDEWNKCRNIGNSGTYTRCIANKKYEYENYVLKNVLIDDKPLYNLAGWLRHVDAMIQGRFHLP